MTKVLITGAAGFIGSNILGYLPRTSIAEGLASEAKYIKES